MTTYRNLAVALLAVICMAALTPKAQAQLLDEKVRVTFSAPVEVPGRVLPAGTYVFMALEPNHVTRILSADERTVYGTFLTLPEERVEPVEKPTVILGENATGAPERITAWFYPGNSVGSEFLYQDSSSRSKLTASLDTVGKGIDKAAMDGTKGALVSSEFVGHESGRIVVNSGKAIGHATKYFLS